MSYDSFATLLAKYDKERPVEDFLKSLNTTEEPTTYGKNGLDEMIFNVIVIHTQPAQVSGWWWSGIH